MNKPLVAISILTMVGLSSCFTGIESTPKITAADARREKANVVSPEEMILNNLLIDELSKWPIGKRIRVVSDRVGLVLYPAPDKSLEGSDLRYDGIDSVKALSGDMHTMVKFVTPTGQNVAHRIEQSPQQVLSRKSVKVPFTIDLDIVDKVNDKLKGLDVYLMTRRWNTLSGGSFDGLKFVKAMIDSVTPGDQLYPLRVYFTTVDGVSASVFMSIGSDRQSTRNFDTLFSLSDPHLRYPQINAATWQLIMKGDIKEDMTREECRLSIGAPKEINRIPGYNGLTEQWIYPDGSYLIFEDGLLRRFRR